MAKKLSKAQMDALRMILRSDEGIHSRKHTFASGTGASLVRLGLAIQSSNYAYHITPAGRAACDEQSEPRSEAADNPPTLQGKTLAETEEMIAYWQKSDNPWSSHQIELWSSNADFLRQHTDLSGDLHWLQIQEYAATHPRELSELDHLRQQLAAMTARAEQAERERDEAQAAAAALRQAFVGFAGLFSERYGDNEDDDGSEWSEQINAYAEILDNGTVGRDFLRQHETLVAAVQPFVRLAEEFAETPMRQRRGEIYGYNDVVITLADFEALAAAVGLEQPRQGKDAP